VTGETSTRTLRVSRRALLGAGAGIAAAGTAGCAQRVGNLFDDGMTNELTLTVKTEPADEDAVATRIARTLVKNLQAVGVDARIELKPARELWKDVLLAENYDIYVGRTPERGDPDFLRPLLHSAFGNEPGWQNPFSFVDPVVDDLLVAQQRAAGSDRREVVRTLQHEIARKQPLGVVATPSDIWTARTDRFDGWSRYPVTDPLNYIALERTDQEAESTLRVTTTNEEPTKNLNPLAIEHRSRGLFTGLVYDPLVRRVGETVTPWLAEEWSWHRDGDTAVCTVRLRPDLTWHDDTALTAEDAAFTYRLLNDMLLSDGETSVPSPHFRGRASLVNDVTATDARTLRIRCPGASPEVGTRALTVPILPAHVWRERAVETETSWADGSERVSQALVWPNPTPVGSGAVRFGNRTEGESLVFERFDDHFLHRQSPSDVPDELANGVPFDRLAVRIAPSSHAAVQLLSADEADVTAMRLTPDAVPRIGEEDALELHVDRSDEFYHIGFNADRSPLGDTDVRRAIVRLLDKSHIVETIFDGFGRPASTLLAGTDWEPPDLVWRSDDPDVPFVGDDGELDQQRARNLLSDAGLEYNDDGRVLDQ
jgi:peptide/nickel transport system substrate-binding protein